MSIYTRTGDRGETSLFDGERVLKSDTRLEAYGTVDELNSAIGVVIASLPEACAAQAETLRAVQSILFYAGSCLATPATSQAANELPPFPAGKENDLEAAIDTMMDELPQVTGFVLPGGSLCAAHSHVARTVCRRAERRIVAYAHSIPDPELSPDYDALLVFVNRLSDYLFTLARYANHQAGVADAPREILE